MKSTGLNSWRSFIVAVTSALVYCLFLVVFRQSALFYAALIEHYNMDRKTASIPFVALGFVRCFSGFIFGLLGEKFGLQRMTFIGCYLSVLGIGTSYFAQNVITLSITLGLIHGFGMTGTALLASIIRDHFDDTATSLSNGILNLGPGICSIVFPSIIIHLIDEYGVSGAFLLSSGIVLNAIPFIMILKKPRKDATNLEKAATEIKKTDEVVSEAELIDIQSKLLKTIAKPINKDIIKACEDNCGQADPSGNKAGIVKITSTFIEKKIPKCLLHRQEGCLSCINIPSALKRYEPQNISDTAIIKNVFGNSQMQSERSSETLANKTYFQLKPGNSLKDNTHRPKPILYPQHNDIIEKSVTAEAGQNNEKKKGFLYALNALKDPTFMALTLVQGFFAYTYNIWLTTMIDYSRDKGIDRSYEIYILTLHPIADLVGRCGLFWVTDKGFLSITYFSALIYILLTVSSIWMALANNFATMTSGIMLMTFSIGSFLNIYPGMSYAFIEKDKQILSITSMGLLYAPLSFSVSPLIGLFRERLGSYDGLYYLLAVMNFACSLIVLLLPRLANMRETRKLKKFPKEILL